MSMEARKEACATVLDQYIGSNHDLLIVDSVGNTSRGYLLKAGDLYLLDVTNEYRARGDVSVWSIYHNIYPYAVNMIVDLLDKSVVYVWRE